MIASFSFSQKALSLLGFLVIGMGVGVGVLISAPGGKDEGVVIVSKSDGRLDVAKKLREGGWVRSETFARFALFFSSEKIEAGGYRVSKSWSLRRTVGVFSFSPSLVWISIPEGWRKEQIAERLRKRLGWSEEQTIEWVAVHTALKYDEVEGVYFPDTYLIPIDEEPAKIADRLRRRFFDQFNPLQEQFAKENIKWDTGLKVASIIQREAAGTTDMKLISGILWKRLLTGMKLEIDATIQYVRDTQEQYDGTAFDYRPDETFAWWRPIKVADKEIVSPYNTYLNKGLPPHPIGNPGMAAIEAALHPEVTDCVFYLHDRSRVIHCTPTYEEHLQNIERYLR